jgi:hypothetical protein
MKAVFGQPAGLLPAVTVGGEAQSMNLVATGRHFEKFTAAAFLHHPFRYALRDIRPNFLEVSRLRII